MKRRLRMLGLSRFAAVFMVCFASQASAQTIGLQSQVVRTEVHVDVNVAPPPPPPPPAPSPFEAQAQVIVPPPPSVELQSSSSLSIPLSIGVAIGGGGAYRESSDAARGYASATLGVPIGVTVEPQIGVMGSFMGADDERRNTTSVFGGVRLKLDAVGPSFYVDGGAGWSFNSRGDGLPAPDGAVARAGLGWRYYFGCGENDHAIELGAEAHFGLMDNRMNDAVFARVGLSFGVGPSVSHQSWQCRTDAENQQRAAAEEEERIRVANDPVFQANLRAEREAQLRLEQERAQAAYEAERVVRIREAEEERLRVEAELRAAQEAERLRLEVEARVRLERWRNSQVSVTIAESARPKTHWARLAIGAWSLRLHAHFVERARLIELARLQAEAQAQAEAEARLRIEIEARAQADAQAQAEARARVDAQAQVEAHAHIDAEAQVEVQAGASSDAEVQAHTPSLLHWGASIDLLGGSAFTDVEPLRSPRLLAGIAFGPSMFVGPWFEARLQFDVLGHVLASGDERLTMYTPSLQARINLAQVAPLYISAGVGYTAAVGRNLDAPESGGVAIFGAGFRHSFACTGHHAAIRIGLEGRVGMMQDRDLDMILLTAGFDFANAPVYDNGSQCLPSAPPSPREPRTYIQPAPAPRAVVAPSVVVVPATVAPRVIVVPPTPPSLEVEIDVNVQTR